MAAASRDHRKGKGPGVKNRASSSNGKGQSSAKLPWKPVPLPMEAVASGGQSDADFFQGLNFDDDDYMGIKEVEGVEVVKKDDGTLALVSRDSTKGKAREEVVQPVTSKSKEAPRRTTAADDDSEAAPVEDEGRRSSNSSAADETEDIVLPDVDFEQEADEDDVLDAQDEDHKADFRLLMRNDEEKEAAGTWSRKAYNQKLPGWAKMDIPLQNQLKASLHKLGYTKPTSIQQLSLSHSMSKDGRDVVGVAQTGSGKTLAYGLPILNWICETSVDDRQMNLMDGVDEEGGSTRLAALILAPTRELALQVSRHLEEVIAASSSDEKSKWASVATLTGGISEEKQRRLLQGYQGRGADIVVATPGRLWDMCKGDDSLTKRIKLTRFLVVDEADRMVESGHFAEMENILALVKRPDVAKGSHLHSTASIAGGASDMQTFIFSATLSKDLQRNLKRASRKKKAKGDSTLEELIGMIDFRDEDPEVIDLSTSNRLATRLIESKIECLSKDKDLYLYYFLLRYPGRTLVFVNSIDGIRRLQPLLENLQLSVQPLHSQLQQRQRLKNLDKFRSSRLPSIQGSTILLATDVAARGLDIPAVDHVVHFQLPRTADTYVHRSGRTARAGKSGISLALIEPAEKRLWRDLSRSLKRTEEVQSMPVEYSFLPELKERVNLARELDQLSHTERKAAHDDAWLRKMASEADMDISEDEEDIDAGTKSKENKKAQSVRVKLEQSLRKPLTARGISFKYITSGSRDFVQSLLDDGQHGEMLGVHKSRAEDDLHEDDRTSNKKRKRS